MCTGAIFPSMRDARYYKKSLLGPQGATFRHGDPSIQFMVLPVRPGELSSIWKYINFVIENWFHLFRAIYLIEFNFKNNY